MAVELIDTHAHTNFDAFDADRDDMFHRAREAGVVAVVEVGVGLEGSRRAGDRAAERAMVHAAFGLHPTGLETFDADWPPFEALVRGGGCVAVGECGLDYHWMTSPKDVQAEAFRRQIRLARDLDLPFIVHCREAENDLLPILSEEGYTRGVVHCFGGTRAHAEALLAMGMRLSFCGNVTYKKADGLRDAARATSLETLMLETDAPFLAPRERRGKRNEPAFVRETASVLAELLGTDLATLAAATTRNARAFFGLETA